METEAKFGMFAGVAAVIVIAVVYFQKPQVGSGEPITGAPAAASSSASPPTGPLAGMVVPSSSKVTPKPSRQ